MIASKIVLFTFVLCAIAVKLPLKVSANRIARFAQNSLRVVKNEFINDDEKTSKLRLISLSILLETFKIAFWITILVLLSMALWWAFNFQDGFDPKSFDVFLTAKGVLFSCAGILVYVVFKKLLRLVRL